MGAFRSSIPRLLWLYLVGACFLFLIPNTNFQVFAENDADLVFENNLEESKISPANTHTIERRDTSHENSELHSKSSHPEEEDHWLTTAAKRFKRQLFNIGGWFPSKDNSRERRDSGEPGQGQRGQQTDDDDYNNLDDDDEGSVERLVPESQKDPDISGILRPDQQTDDEDDFGDRSGDGSGLGVVPGQPIYYRITLTVIEPFVEQFSDRNSRQYRELAEKLVRAVDELFEQIDGRQSATVIKIEKREADIFSSKVTMDLSTINNYDHGRIRNHLYSHIRNYHTLGPYKVSDEDFTFREFEGNTRPLPNCQFDELPCHSGECVPASARCNGIFECEDQSDERGCDFNVNEVDLRPEFPHRESHGRNRPRPRPHVETTTSPNLLSTIFGDVFNTNTAPQQPPYQPPQPVETTTPNMFVTIFEEIYNKTHGLEEEPDEVTTESRPWYSPEQPPYIPPDQPQPPYRSPYEPVETTTQNMFVPFNEEHPEKAASEPWPWFPTRQPLAGREPPFMPPVETTTNMFVSIFNDIYNRTHGLEDTDTPGETTTSQPRPWFSPILPEEPYRPPQQPETTTRNMFETIFNVFNPTEPVVTTPSYPQSSRPTINRCRADDVVRCADDITYICADQQCDGNPDCPYGDDERNCRTACAEGELSCDISRCIPLSKRCDGVDDCEDKTDEIECVAADARGHRDTCPPKSEDI